MSARVCPEINAMAHFKIMLARSPAEIRAHLRKRWLIFGREEGYLPKLAPPVAMEFDAFDRYATARHFIIVLDEEGGHA
jgi:hypothetical protein